MLTQERTGRQNKEEICELGGCEGEKDRAELFFLRMEGVLLTSSSSPNLLLGTPAVWLNPLVSSRQQVIEGNCCPLESCWC